MTASPRLIALCSPAMGSGKTQVALHLEHAHGFTRVRFAAALKAMVTALLERQGYPARTIPLIVDGELKETELGDLGEFNASQRDAMIWAFLTAAGFTRGEIGRLMDGPAHERPVPGIGVTPKYLVETLDRWGAAEVRNGTTSRRLQQSLGTEWGRNRIRPDLWVQLARLRIRVLQAQGRSVVIDDMRFPNEHLAVQHLGGTPARIVRPGASVTTAAHASEGHLDAVEMTEIVNDGSIADLHARVDQLLRDMTWVDTTASSSVDSDSPKTGLPTA